MRVEITSWQQMQTLTFGEGYHCEHFFCDAYRFLTGVDVADKLLENQHFSPFLLRHWQKVDQPVPFCAMLFRDGRQAHVGLWYDHQVLHLGENGVVLQPLFVLLRSFKRVDCYVVKKTN